MKPAHEERNNRIRRIYEKRIIELKRQGEKKFMDIAISELKHQFNAWELSYETIKEIIYRPDYGARWMHIQVLAGKVWEQFIEKGEPVKSQRIGDLKRELKRLGDAHPDRKFRIKKMPNAPAPKPEAVTSPDPIGGIAAPIDQAPGSVMPSRESDFGEKSFSRGTEVFFAGT